MSGCETTFTNVEYCDNKHCRKIYIKNLSDAGAARLQTYCDQRSSYEHEKILKPDGTIDESLASKVLVAIALAAGPLLILKLLGKASPYITNAAKNGMIANSQLWAYFFKFENRPIADWPESGIKAMDEFKGFIGMNPTVYGKTIAEDLEFLPDVLKALTIVTATLGDITITLVHNIFRLAVGLAKTVLFKLPGYVIGAAIKAGVKLTNAGIEARNFMADPLGIYKDFGSDIGAWSAITEPGMEEAGEAVVGGMKAVAEKLGFAWGYGGIADSVLIGFQILGAVLDAWDPCKLKTELDSSALKSIQSKLNSVFHNSLYGQFTTTTLDGAQIVDDTWPIPYFADTYAQSFLDTYGTTIDANPVTCRTDSDCPPSPGDSKTPGSSVFCEPSGYCTVPWKDSIQRKHMKYQQLYLNSLIQTPEGFPIYHIPSNCATNDGSTMSSLFANIARGIGVSMGGGNTYVENWISKWWPLIFFVITVLLFVLLVLIK